MYITHSLVEGLKILGFDKETIKKVSKERSLEEIFLSVLFLNYTIILIVYFMGILSGGFSISGRELNMSVLLGLLMIYPFTFNLVAYLIYGFFGLMAEMLDNKKHIKPLISVGFHTAIVYAIIFYIIGLSAMYSLSFAAFVSSLFIIYFLYTMFVSISTIYNFSINQVLIVVFVPFLLISLILLGVALFAPQVINSILALLFI